MAENTEHLTRRSIDRRTRKRPPLKFLVFGGRRVTARRNADKETHIYVDRYSPWLMVLIVILIALSFADGFFTLYLIEHGATEVNPIMAFFLEMGPWPFMIIKFFLTCFGILCLLVLHNMYFRPLRMRVKNFFPLFIAIFILIISWQLFLNIIKNIY